VTDLDPMPRVRPRLRRWLRRIGLVLAGLAIAAVAVWAFAALYPSGVPSGPGGQPAGPDDFSCPEPCSLFTISWTGDTMIGNGAKRKIKEHGYGYVLEHVPAMIEADYAIGNAEAPFTGIRKKHDPKQYWSYRTKPRVAGELAAVGFDAFSLANNHAWDRGPKGAEDTRRHLEAAGMELFGVGVDDVQAEAPLLIPTPYGTVGVVGLESAHTRGEEAATGAPGTARIRRRTIERAHRRAKEAGADWVVAFVHWGMNYRGINIEQKWFARRFADAGYDLVVGHGPHIEQPVGRVGGMPVLYSLGNFVFNSPGRFQKLDKPPWGLVAKTYLGPDGFEGIELLCFLADNKRTDYKPRPCTEPERAEAFPPLGPEVAIRGELGVVTW
jgi:hypothetical protein